MARCHYFWVDQLEPRGLYSLIKICYYGQMYLYEMV